MHNGQNHQSGSQGQQSDESAEGLRLKPSSLISIKPRAHSIPTGEVSTPKALKVTGSQDCVQIQVLSPPSSVLLVKALTDLSLSFLFDKRGVKMRVNRRVHMGVNT